MEPSGFSLGFHPDLKTQYELILILELIGVGTKVGKEKIGTQTWILARTEEKISNASSPGDVGSLAFSLPFPCSQRRISTGKVKNGLKMTAAG